jgi:hypothetical protein
MNHSIFPSSFTPQGQTRSIAKLFKLNGLNTNSTLVATRGNGNYIHFSQHLFATLDRAQNLNFNAAIPTSKAPIAPLKV